MINPEVFKKIEHAPPPNLIRAVTGVVRRLTGFWILSGTTLDLNTEFQATGLAAAGIAGYVDRRLDGMSARSALDDVLLCYKYGFMLPPNPIPSQHDNRESVYALDLTYGLIVDKVWLTAASRRYPQDVNLALRRNLYGAAILGYDKIVKVVRR